LRTCHDQSLNLALPGDTVEPCCHEELRGTHHHRFQSSSARLIVQAGRTVFAVWPSDWWVISSWPYWPPLKIGAPVVLIFYCSLIKYHGCNVLKQHLFIISQLSRSEVQVQQFVSSGFYTKIKVLARLHFFLETLGMHLLFSLFRFMTEFSSLQLYD